MSSIDSQEAGQAIATPVTTISASTDMEPPVDIVAPTASDQDQFPIDIVSVGSAITSRQDQIRAPGLIPPDSALNSRPTTSHSCSSTAPTDVSWESNAKPEEVDTEPPSPPQSPLRNISSGHHQISKLILPPASEESYENLKENQSKSARGSDAWSCPASPKLQSSSDTPYSSRSCPGSPLLNPANPNTATSQATPLTQNNKSFKYTASSARLEWTRRKLLDGETNDVIDELMRYEGIEEVKQQFLDIKSKVDCCKEQGRDPRSERFNIVFQGNPGTGKTTIARLYAKLLHSLNILKSDYVKETSGIKIAAKGAIGIKRKLSKMTASYSGGGVLFVDEAYQLTAPYTDGAGRPALDVILTSMENNIGKLVVIFVGYKDEMESFFEHNPGLSSRIPYTMNFADFTDWELFKILCDSITNQYNGKMQVEGGMDGLYMRIAIRRLAQNRGSKSFGNARAVQNLLARISQRQSQRLAREKKYGRKPNYLLFTKEDLIGPDPTTASQNSEAWAELQNLIGLDRVKECVRSMIRIIRLNYRRELREKPPLKFSLNQLFVGNPGTGKTTVARLYGRILADLGYLSRGEVVLKNPADFIGECLGKSEAKTRRILEATVGKILVIDEAYMLDAGDPHKEQDKFKTGVIDTLVSMVQGVPGEDRCIILIGYEDKIRDMFQNVNPGLSRRFPIERPFRFENFDLSQLEQILRLKMREQELSCPDHAISIACEVLERSLMRPNFTNAGEVDSLLSTAKMNYERRLSSMHDDCLDDDLDVLAVDFDPDYDRGSRVDCRELMEGLVHDSITKKLNGYQRQCSGARKHNLNPRDLVPTRFIFKGPPGTGKTTTAQKMGEIFYGMGFLSTSEVVECSVADLLGQYVGQTVPKTRKKLQEGVGRVLFIDEVYRLIYGQYAAEAVEELIQFLTKPTHKGKMIVILAGYVEDVHLLLSIRPTLASLFPEEIIFDNIPPDDCTTLLARELQLMNFTSEQGFLANPSSSDYSKVKRLFHAMQLIPSWSNARDVKNLAQQVLTKFLESVGQGGIQQSRTLSAAHITSCMRQTITQQRDRCIAMGSNNNVSLPQQPSLGGTDSYPMPAHPQLAPPPPPVTSAICTPGAGNDCSAMNHGSSIETRVQGQNQSAVSHVNAVYTQIPGPQDRSLHEDGPGSTDIREEGVSEATWQELIEAKKTQNTRRIKRDAEVKQLERALQDVESAVSNGPGDDSNDPTYNAIRDKLSKIQQRMQDEERVQHAIEKMNVCVNGFTWSRVAGGYRCAGGMHFVTDSEIQSRLM